MCWFQASTFLHLCSHCRTKLGLSWLCNTSCLHKLEGEEWLQGQGWAMQFEREWRGRLFTLAYPGYRMGLLAKMCNSPSSLGVQDVISWGQGALLILCSRRSRQHSLHLEDMSEVWGLRSLVKLSCPDMREGISGKACWAVSSRG